MSLPILIEIGSLELDAFLDEGPAATAFHASLPLELPFECWGDSLYFGLAAALPDDVPEAAEIAPGDIGYSPSTRSIYLCFGPASGEPHPGPFQMIGRIGGDPAALGTQTGEILIRLLPEPLTNDS